MTKEKYAWIGIALPLNWLAELENGPAPNSLPGAFGDGYLCRYNPAFAAIREKALALGYRFSAEDTPLWRDYHAFSLIALHRILEDKTVPYFDNVSTFRRLIAANPTARLPPAFIVGNLKRNYAFHESAHCVAHSIMQATEGQLRTVAPCEGERNVLAAVLAESFANTVEAVGSVFRHLPLSDGVFYSLNSYFSQNQKLQDVLHNALAELGAELRFTLLLVSYLEANLAVEAPPEATYDRIAEAGDCGFGQTGLSREIAGIAFRLSAGFRESTTPAYFELMGLAKEYNALAKAGWLAQPRNISFIRMLAHLFWEAAGKP